MIEYAYRVADFPFVVRAPRAADLGALLPSFAPFRCRPGSAPLFVCTLRPEPLPWQPPAGPVLDESDTDLGHTRLSLLPGGYRVDLSYGRSGQVHMLCAAADFTRAEASVRWTDPAAGAALSSLLRIVFAQAVLPRGAVSLHASAVCRDGRAYLFMGRSGTGKSTHARQWLAALSGTYLLNDDNPTVRLHDDRPWAYGTPWSGKTPCYRNQRCLLGGVARLRQAAVNRYEPLAGADAFVALFPGSSVITTDARLHSALCGTLSRLAESVPVGRLSCRPDAEAARLCWDAFQETTSSKNQITNPIQAQ